MIRISRISSLIWRSRISRILSLIWIYEIGEQVAIRMTIFMWLYENIKSGTYVQGDFIHWWYWWKKSPWMKVAIRVKDIDYIWFDCVRISSMIRISRIWSLIWISRLSSVVRISRISSLIWIYIYWDWRTSSN